MIGDWVERALCDPNNEVGAMCIACSDKLQLQ